MDVLMPQLGETVSEGKVTTWFKSVGDKVQPGDNLFEIETDKVSMEIQATEAGILSDIRVPVGAVAPVGAVVAIIGGSVAAAPASPAPATSAALPGPPGKPAPPSRTAPTPPKPAPAPAAALAIDPYFEVRTPAKNYGTARTAAGMMTTPLARRLAGEAGIDIAKVKGSGPRGRIVAADIKAAAPPPAAAALASGPTSAEVKALYKDVPFDEVPLDGMRKTIARRLQQAAQTIPHFYIADDVAVGALTRLREELNAAAWQGKDGKPAYKFSLNDFIIKAWAAALQAVPAANAVWAEDRILRFSRSDVAVAVALEGGLITPLIRDAGAKSLRAVSVEMRDLATRARDRKLLPHEYQGGASAISNLGMYGVREFSAIINPPHATILAVGGVRRQMVEQADGTGAFASLMTVTLSCDHRVVDGALGAELLTAFKAIVENPVRLLV
ncbi:MAG TPA: 2-oxo acid dehydrogenase subunit E2 [Bauldia sp.]|nr:2-oxo acid dehydrogenase subunit E2 [Bauldia sp.]